MRVLHVVHGYPPSTGGAQWLTKNLSEQLVSRYHDEVTVFTTVAYNMEHFWRSDEPAMPAGAEEINGVTVRRFAVFNHLNVLRMLIAGVAYRLHLPCNDWLRTIYNGPLIFGMTRTVASSGADVVFATAFPLLHMHYALAGARRAGIPIVFLGAIHTADTWGYDRKMIYRAIQQADAYIALTTFECDYLIKRGIRADKISVIGPGVDVSTFVKADGTVIRRRYGWGNAPVVALVAKQTARKRFDVLLEAMRRVWAVHPNARLLIAGVRTPYSRQIERMIGALPPEQQAHVTEVGDFPEEEKPALLAACDLFVLPSGYESFGIAFLEAWACGKPVIGARTGAIPSVIDEGQDGLLVAYQDADDLARAILELLADPQRRAQMGEVGRRKVLENHTWEIVADRVRAVYVEAISRRARLKNEQTSFLPGR
ncbi:MAG TPA: glycosyltransferase family 1 protein [Anaerolineae bacterium]|nr:glycosyltransferase family 1 protein [Anaerolineae bacterium]